ncbi:LysR family transcriptional regulator [Verrucomicrobia bacterium LW23]|nr:LysR family transcriptional regulator [Verrucomicrobia bacterium LW23]
MLDNIRMFLVALEEGSLNRAAVRLRVSQPALTRHMQALEAELGGELFERTPSGIRPTDAGHALAASMPPVIAAYEAGVAEARRLLRGQRDLLRVGYLGSAAQRFLNPALALLRQSLPRIKVKLLDLSPGEQITALRQGEIDLAIIGQEGGFAANEFYTRKLATLPVVALLPADHALAGQVSISLQELAGERFIGAPEADMPGRDRWITQLCRRAGFRPRFAHVAQTISESFSLVSSEGAVTLGPGYLQGYPAAGVAMVPVREEYATWDFLIVWQRGKTAASALALLDALAAVVKQECDAKEMVPPEAGTKAKRARKSP